MSYVQSILNRRLGIQRTIETEKVDEPPKMKPVEEPKEEEQKVEEPPNPPKKTELPRLAPVPKKNARGAGRKKQNEEEFEKKRQTAVNRLTKGNMEDLETVNQLKENTTKKELTEEIKNTKKKLQLLSDAVLFVDK